MGYLFSLSKSSTLTCLAVSEWALLLFGALLVVGLIIEYRAVHESRWMKFGELLVIIGVAGELLGDGGIFVFSSHLQTVADQEIVELTRNLGSARDLAHEAQKASNNALAQSETANEIAGKAQETADAVKTKADSLTSRLNTASDRLNDIEQDVLAEGPRWRLLDRGRDEFIKSLKPFARQKSTVVICGQGDSERMPFEQLLMDLLRKAEWANPGYQAWHGCPNMLSGGNEIYFVSASATRTQWLMPYTCTGSLSVPTTEDVAKAGRALCDALNRLKIGTMAWIEAPIHSPQTREQEIARANMFSSSWAGSSEGNPAGLALEAPTTIFILVGPNQPMFTNRSKKLKSHSK